VLACKNVDKYWCLLSLCAVKYIVASFLSLFNSNRPHKEYRQHIETQMNYKHIYQRDLTSAIHTFMKQHKNTEVN